ncbi:MAG: methyltransferase domain-containing protein [Myxococcales bacterium]|nr:methyltransferase domain-containing protein [Myxococcales bacterium]
MKRTVLFAGLLAVTACGGSASPPNQPPGEPSAKPAPSAASVEEAPKEPAWVSPYDPVSQAGAEPETDKKLREAIASGNRSRADQERDVWRHPLETLEFFGLKSDMQVLELWPGTGWYTQILAPVLVEKGALHVTNLDPNGPQDVTPNRIARQFDELLKSSPERFGKLQLHQVAPPEKLDLGPDASMDLVLSFRNTHNWVKAGYALEVYDAAYRVLKPGGVLGVVQHRGEPGKTPEQTGYVGYLAPDFVKRLIEAAGFELSAESELNANPKDTKDYPEGVWTLPPVLRLGEKDAAKYEAIGESDRMTLRFVKPPHIDPELKDASGKPLPQTEGEPKFDSPLFKQHLRLLTRAIVLDDPEIARSVFFPVEAYQQVKDIPKPERDWEYRLWKNFKRDVHDYHKRLGANPRFARLLRLDTSGRRQSWMKPGSEGNKIGYFRMTHPKLVFQTAEGKELRVDLTSLISWRGEWYVVHLNGFK